MYPFSPYCRPLNPGCPVVSRGCVSLISSGLLCFLVFLGFDALHGLEHTGQVFCRMALSLDLSDVFLRIKTGF